MKRISCLILLFSGIALFSAAPVMHFDFSKADAQGNVPNLGTGNFTGKIHGDYQLLPGGILKLDGRTGFVTVEGTEDFDVGKNATFSLLYRREKLSDNDLSNQSNDAFFSKAGVFIMTKYKNHFYGNVHNGKKWAATCQIFDTFPEAAPEWCHVVMSIEYFRNWNEAEEWVEFCFYLNGVCVGRERFKDIQIRKNRNKLEIGSNFAMGPSWMLGGEIAEARVYDRLLSQSEIRELTLAQTLAKPAFKLEKQLSAEDRAVLQNLPISSVLKRGLANLAVMDTNNVNWRKVLEDPEKFLTAVEGEQSDLVLVHTDDFAHICSWYDKKADRELLQGDNPFVDWCLTSGKQTKTLNPLDEGIRSVLLENPVLRNGTWHFRIGYSAQGTLAFTGYSDFEFRKDRLEFRHTAEPMAVGVNLFSVSFPKFSFRAFQNTGETLAVPYGCGVLYENPTQNNIRYSNPYPRAFAAMQFVSYYDQVGGIYVATEDPRGRQKQITFICSKGRIDGDFLWRVPYEKIGTSNPFNPECRAAAELFRGDWYESGMIYRRVLAEIDAPWWRKSLPNTDTPAFFRNNSIWISGTYLGEYDPTLFQLREYFGQDFYHGDIWKWWNEFREIAQKSTSRPASERLSPGSCGEGQG